MRRAIVIGVLAAAMAVPGTAAAAIYSNTAPLGPADNAPLAPYPSSITVGGEAGTTVNVTATLVGVAGSAVREMDALLLGPGGRSILLSDACSNALIPDWTGQNVTLDDNASVLIPDPCNPGGPMGTVRPYDLNNGADNFPGLSPPYPVGLAAFRGLSPNGIWSLYVVDDAGPDALTVSGGWQLSVTTTGPPAKKKKKCKKRKKASAAKRKKCRKKKKKR
jgi:hypothetical protein